MAGKVLVVYYSSYGHVHRMAGEVVRGAESVEGTEVRLRRIPELEAARAAMSSQEWYVKAQEAQADIPEATYDDLRWADGIVWGIPTRYGNMPAQVKQFIDGTGALWAKGELEDKATGIFTSTANVGGGQETTVITSLIPMLHLGMIFVGTPYGQNPELFGAEGRGGSPYGAGTIAGPDGSRQPANDELTTARNLGSRVAKVAGHLRPLRATQAHGQQPDAPTYEGK